MRGIGRRGTGRKHQDTHKKRQQLFLFHGHTTFSQKFREMFGLHKSPHGGNSFCSDGAKPVYARKISCMSRNLCRQWRNTYRIVYGQNERTFRKSQKMQEKMLNMT